MGTHALHEQPRSCRCWRDCLRAAQPRTLFWLSVPCSGHLDAAADAWGSRILSTLTCLANRDLFGGVSQLDGLPDAVAYHDMCFGVVVHVGGHGETQVSVVHKRRRLEPHVGHTRVLGQPLLRGGHKQWHELLHRLVRDAAETCARGAGTVATVAAAVGLRSASDAIKNEGLSAAWSVLRENVSNPG